MRYLAAICCLFLLLGCGSQQPKKTEEEIRRQEAEEARDQPRERRNPDGAFGAKDYATDARQASEEDTKALEEAAEAAQ
jgi:hypothetical protein